MIVILMTSRILLHLSEGEKYEAHDGDSGEL